MKKAIIVCLMLFIILSMVGCKKKSVTDDIYKDDVINNDEPVVEEVIEEPIVEEVVEPTVEIVEPEVETPVEDVYESASVPIDFDFSEFEGVEPTIIEDEKIKQDIYNYLKPFYFNYFFENGVNAETGNVEADAMTLFALSYIMQNEYNELRFDHTTFTLYIPKEHVIDIVQKYFYRQLDVFNGYEELSIGYENDIYSVVVKADEWDVEFNVMSIEQLGDFTYKVICETTSKTTNRIKEQIDVIIDKSNNSYVIINYTKSEIEE